MTQSSSETSAKMVLARKPWVKPRLDRIRAGEAEVFTRAAADGPFSSS